MKDLKKRILAFFCLEYEVSCWFKLHDNQPITEIVKVMNEEELVSAYKFFQERELREAIGMKNQIWTGTASSTIV